MNRRELLKVLAGMGALLTPVGALLRKVPKAETGLVQQVDVAEVRRRLEMVTAHAKEAAESFGNLADTLREGRTIFVDLDRVADDDANDGLSPEAPVTWEKAWLETAEPGEAEDVIYVLGEET